MNVAQMPRMVVVAGLLLSLVSAGSGAELDETTKSAVYLLRACKKTRGNIGRAGRMLRALRQLRDPELKPFFTELAESDNSWQQVQGMLGLAECDGRMRIDLVRLSKFESPEVQRSVVSAAMDLDMLDVDLAKQLMNWPGLDGSVRVVVATFLLRQQVQPDLHFLREISQSEKIGRAMLSALLLAQTGDGPAMQQLEKLSQSDIPHRDTVRSHLLFTAFRSEFDRVRDWALSISTEPNADDRLRRLALKTALRFGAAGAADVWPQQFSSASDSIQQAKLALLALNVAHWVDAGLFDPLIFSSDPSLQVIGRAGAAVAARKGVVEAVLRAIELNQTQVSEWALDYAKEIATDDTAHHIFLALILAFDGPSQGLAQRLGHAITATEALTDHNVDAAVSLIRPILADGNTDDRLVRGILAGLAQCRQTDPFAVIKGMGFDDPQADSLVLLIAARHGHDLDESQLRDLELLVQGGGNFSPYIRVQAAWAYLRRTGRTKLALAEVLGP